eukprot:gene21662-64619_t
MGVALGFAILVTAPLHVLQREMSWVAQMKLDKVDEERPPSKLTEV